MARNQIKGITIEIGGDTTRLDKALAGTDKQLKQTQSNLKDVERLLKMDPGNTELLAQKQRLLADAVKSTEERLRTLETAAEQAYHQLEQGEISQQEFDSLNRELIETRMNLEEVTRAANDFDIDQEIQNAENELHDLRDAADDADDSLDDLSDSSEGLSGRLGGLSGIAGGVAISIGQKLVEAAMAAVEWLWSLDEATEEYRVAMGKLNTAFEVAGQSAETAQGVYQGFFNILGDTDTAVEASQLLAQLANNEKDMAEWLRIAAGAYGTFGDALPIEGLIEAANETAKTGKVTGVLADALNWLGLSEDAVNESLALMSDEAERAQFIMDGLSTAYGDAADAFYENNEALISSREAQAKMDESMGALGESIANVKTQLMGAFGEPLSIILNAAASGIQALGQTLNWLGDRIQEVANFFRELFNVSGRWEGGKLVPTGRAVLEDGQGGRSFSLRSLSAQDVPYLAKGTVTRPNSPFMAVVGDAQEPEIVSPLSTIERAVRNVVGSGGSQPGSIQVNVNFAGSAAQLVRMLQPMITVDTDRRGPQLVN